MARFAKIANALVPLRIRGHLPFFFVLVLAAAVRLWGIDFGLPHTMCRPDEETVAALALRFFKGHFRTNFFSYPPLFMYIAAALYAIAFAVGKLVGIFSSGGFFGALSSLTPWTFILIDRLASAACGVASVAILYTIGRRLLDRTTARVAAAFLSLAFLHVRDSHFGVTDITATCIILASFYFTVRFAKDGRSKDMVRSAVLVGLAASTKYTALLIGIPALAAVAGLSLRPSRCKWPTRIRRLANFGLVALFALLAMMPSAMANWRQFFAGLYQEFGHLMAGHGLLLGRGWIVHLTTSLRYGLGLPLLIASIVGLIWMARMSPRRAFLLGLFPVAYFLMMGRGYTVFARYMLPIIPFLCLTGAWAIVRLSSALASVIGQSTKGTWITVLLAALFIAPSTWNVVRIDRLLAIPDSRLLADAWLRSNMPAGATVYQSGSIYSQVQWKGPSLFAPAEDWSFEEAAARFFRAGAPSVSQPDFVIVQESPLELYTAVPRALDVVLAQDYTLVQRIEAYDPAAISGVFDRIDAFFLPLSGFGGIHRPGPNMAIYRKRSH